MSYNASLRKSNVSNNLNNEDYTYTFKGYRFYFSTMKHREKFANLVDARVAWLTDSMCRRFHLWIQCDLLAVVQLYMMVEGRGFKMVSEETGNVALSENDILFDVVMVCAGSEDNND